MISASDKFAGSMLGLALGDACGAPFEGGPVERIVWRLIGKTSGGRRRWTDDTQMSLDVADSLIAHGRLDVDDLATRFAGSYRWSLGYGPGTAKLLKRVARGASWEQANRSVYPEGSFGNGGAMRAPVIGLFYCNRDGDRAAAARDSARVTHAHPLGIEGAVLIAEATAKACCGHAAGEILDAVERRCEHDAFRRRVACARQWLASEPDAKQVVYRLGNGTAAESSCVTAVYIGLRFRDRPFDELLQFAVKCGGDVDTIGAMACAIWGAMNGCQALPRELLTRLEGAERIESVARELYRVSKGVA